ncbi:hypothetical protein Q1695_012010 [Nippostrongylus brasiliensis]|nr:hypothetical protein Q1695_012010 [Nippostrongylus brasiliensis]
MKAVHHVTVCTTWNACSTILTTLTDALLVFGAISIILCSKKPKTEPPKRLSLGKDDKMVRPPRAVIPEEEDYGLSSKKIPQPPVKIIPKHKSKPSKPSKPSVRKTKSKTKESKESITLSENDSDSSANTANPLVMCHELYT